jgi:hypothetical protein
MSTNDRQSRLLVTEDWKRIYQSFRNADFQSYDFDNLRRTMINYLRQNYPEDFNDYIESSEYLALIDMIAFLGQNLSFRIDLNARENFLETAERRESILRLARMLAYNPRRNQAANGLLKIATVKTTENITDSSGIKLAGRAIKWNDPTNSNYFEQFIKVLNAALPVSNSVGNPLKSSTIDGVSTQKYRFNATNTSSAIFPFSKNIEGISTRFEVVSTDINGDRIIEEPPLPGTSPAFLFRDDGQGAGSNNTGFFMHFRQGKLENGNFNVSNPIPNQIISIDAENINDSDIWLYNVDSNGFETKAWTKLDSVEGNNIIYNSLFQGVKDVFTAVTRVGDRINLVFSDGVFGNLPSGNFKVYYRTSSNANSVITPSAVGTVNIDVPYQGRNGNLETLTIGLKLNYTVSNGTPTETNEEIKQNAPATYYTQNRLITGEDYNIGPLAVSQDIIKVKSSNRVSSGISRYFDLKDASGKYSNTSLFADDGVIYKEIFETKTDFSFVSQSDVEGIIYNTIEPIISSVNLRNFYFSEYPKVSTVDLSTVWKNYLQSTNRNTGNIVNLDDENSVFSVGSFTTNNLRFIESGSMLKFTAPLSSTGATQYFLPDGTLTTDSNRFGASQYRWTKVVSVNGEGNSVNVDNVGDIVLSDVINEGSRLIQVVPKISKVLTNDLKIQIIDQAFAYKDFALRYDVEDREWKIILSEDINIINNFALGKSGDITGSNLDSSWLLYFKTDGEKYTITHRNQRYIFESENEIRFFFDNSDKIYDTKTGELVRDRIDVLSINRVPNSNESFPRDFSWSISDAYRDAEGYVDSRKIQVQFFDLDDDGSADDLDLFDVIVDPNNVELDYSERYIFQKRYVTTDNVEDYKFFANTNSEIKISLNESNIGAFSTHSDGQIFYLVEEGVFKKLNKTNGTLSLTSDYKAYIGRSGLKFHYVHVADSNYRIDPSASNIIDTYILTKNYDIEMRKYLTGARGTKPLPASSDQLFRSYGASINSIKSISDELVYHPVKYKILFGSKAKEDLQVKFKIVRNKDLVVNENELKSDIIEAIERFFAIENWDFGETFYFQELSAYIMNSLSPKLVSILIVPRQGTQSFGSLFEIKSELDEIFISSASVNDVEIIDEITATSIQASGDVISSVSTSTTTGITSESSSSTNSSTTGGYSY